MAKQDKPKLSVFSGGGPGADRGRVEVDTSDLDTPPIRSVGVGLTQGEVGAVTALAKELGVARNAILHFAVRWFLIQQRAGLVDLSEYLEEPPPPKKSLRLPGKE